MPLSTYLSVFLCEEKHTIGKEGYTDEMAERAFSMAKDILSATDDIFTKCSVKKHLIRIYNIKGEYEKAKEIIHGMKNMWAYMCKDQMHLAAHSLKGKDRLGSDDHPGATAWKIEMSQELFRACACEGHGYYEIGDYESALHSYEKAIAVIELFMRGEEIIHKNYLWDGMQTHHYVYYLDKAGTLNKLGRKTERDEASRRAWHIIANAWNTEKDDNVFETYAKEILPEFYRSMERNDLSEVLPTDVAAELAKYKSE